MSFGNTAKDGSGTSYWLKVNADGRLEVAGAAAHDAAASGNPVQVGSVYRSSTPGVANGDVVNLLVDEAGRVMVNVHNHSGQLSAFITASGAIAAGPAILYGLVIGYKGVTAGDTVGIYDGAYPGGAPMMTVVLPEANGTLVVDLPSPMAFTSDPYALMTLTGGTVYLTGIYG